MPYDVRAVPREGHDGRNRGGRRFLVAHPTRLEDHELTDAIRSDPLLVVMRVEEGPVAPSEEETLKAELAEAGGVAERAEARARALLADLEGVNRDRERLEAELKAEQEAHEATRAEFEAAREKLEASLEAYAGHNRKLEAEIAALKAPASIEEPKPEPTIETKPADKPAVKKGG